VTARALADRVGEPLADGDLARGRPPSARPPVEARTRRHRPGRLDKVWGGGRSRPALRWGGPRHSEGSRYAPVGRHPPGRAPGLSCSRGIRPRIRCCP